MYHRHRVLFWRLNSQHYGLLQPNSCYQVWRDQLYLLALPVPYARYVESQQFLKMSSCGIKTGTVDDLLIHVEAHAEIRVPSKPELQDGT